MQAHFKPMQSSSYYHTVVRQVKHLYLRLFTDKIQSFPSLRARGSRRVVFPCMQELGKNPNPAKARLLEPVPENRLRPDALRNSLIRSLIQLPVLAFFEIRNVIHRLLCVLMVLAAPEKAPPFKILEGALPISIKAAEKFFCHYIEEKIPAAFQRPVGPAKKCI